MNQNTSNVERVHVISMTHLDIGFTNTARNICDQYFNKDLPNGIKLSKSLRNSNSTYRFINTEFPWLILESLDNKAQCAHNLTSIENLEIIKQGILDGDLVWQANALNTFWELTDKEFYKIGLNYKNKLNKMFNKYEGILMGKQTDIPGMSKSLIPLLVYNGIKIFHIGYNGACTVPKLPGEVKMNNQNKFYAFNWLHTQTNTKILMFIEPNYGTNIIHKNLALEFM